MSPGLSCNSASYSGSESLCLGWKKQHHHPKDRTRQNNLVSGGFAATTPESVLKSSPHLERVNCVREKETLCLSSDKYMFMLPPPHPSARAMVSECGQRGGANVLNPVFIRTMSWALSLPHSWVSRIPPKISYWERVSMASLHAIR